MNFDENFIEQLKTKNDIVEVVSAYCNLERKGGAYWACCPLPGHMEKTPSFCVNPVGQFYKCFGCGKGGNVIKFIMEVESLEFYDAVKFLAERAGMELPHNSEYEEKRSRELKSEKEKLYAILKDTARFYVNNLRLPEAEEHRKYLEKRGIDFETQKAFGIGASLDFKSLPKYLLEKGYTYPEMMKAGVVSYNEDFKEYADFEAKRLIIPIIDSFKNVIAFGGRILVKKDFAKYKNTSETVVFSKKHCLYNINNLRQAIRVGGKLDYVIMVEGYMDTISLYTAGFKNVVASMGTSLTQMQAKLLSRYTDTVIISYDGDSAGQNATIRGLEIMRDAGLNVKIISIPDDLDPDDMIKQRGKEAYQKLLDNAMLLIDYKLEVLKKNHNLSDEQGKRDFIDSSIKVIRECPREFEQEELLKKLSSMSGIAYEYLRRDLEKIPQEKKEDNVIPVKMKASNRIVTAERFVLNAVLAKKKYAEADVCYDLEFTDEVRSLVADYIVEKTDNNQEFYPSALFEIVSEKGADELNAILLCGNGVFGTDEEEKYYKDCIKTLRIRTLSSDVDELNELFKNEKGLDERRRITTIINKKMKELKVLRTEDKK